MVRFRSLVCLLAMLGAGLGAGAQQITGSIRGTVSDPERRVCRVRPSAPARPKLA